MHLPWVICMLELPLLVVALRSKACHTHASPYEPLPLTSLQCYNDYFHRDPVQENYTSHITCSWAERMGGQMHTHTPLNLSNENSLCEMTNSSVSGDVRMVRCVYDASKISFTIGGSYTFHFHSHQHAKPRTLSTNLLQHMRVLTPKNLNVVPQQAGGLQLSWDSPYPSTSPLTSGLRYQVTYGTAGQEWTTLNCTHTALKIKEETLLPGRRYEASVRAQAGTWQWSQWSPTVAWSTKDVLGPSEFECVIDSDSMVTCSWKLRRQHAQFLKYSVSCYHLSNDTRVECCPNPELTSDPDSVVLEFRCSLCTSDAEQLRVELSPVNASKTFDVVRNIQPPSPPGFHVVERDQDWVLRWARPGVKRNLPLSYQVCYRPAGSDEWKTFTLTSESLFLLLPGNSLHPSTLYVAKIRALLGQSQTYAGIPSDWSGHVEWKTHSAAISLATILYTTVAVFVVFIFIVMVIFLPKCQRQMRAWKLSIPSPTHSKVLHEVIKKTASGWLYVDSEKVKVSVCVVQEPEEPRSRLSSCKEHRWSSSDEDGDRDSLQLMTYRISSITGGSSGVLDSSGLSFSGPYIFCSKQSSRSSAAFLDHPLGDATGHGDPSGPANLCSPSPSSSSSSSSESLVSPVSDISFLSSLSQVPGGYVATLPMAVPVQEPHPSADPAELVVAAAHDPAGSEDARWQCQAKVASSPSPPSPTEPPPAYTLQPPALHTVVLPRSGYCSLPSLDLSGWASSAPPHPPPGSGPDPAPVTTGGGPPVPLPQSRPQPPEGEQKTSAQERRDQEGKPSDERRPYVRLKTGYTTAQLGLCEN